MKPLRGACDTCKKCNKTVGSKDDAYGCEICCGWTHANCLKAAQRPSDSVKTFLGTSSNFVFVCAECLAAPAGAAGGSSRRSSIDPAGQDTLVEILAGLKQAIEGLNATIQAQGARLDAVEATVAKMAADVSQGARQSLLDDDVIEEHLERLEKRSNLVVVGLPETLDAEREMRRVANSIDGVDEDSIAEIFRDGAKKDNVIGPGGTLYARIVKVKFKEGRSRDRTAFLKGFKRHLHGAWGKAYVRPDMTFKQRQQERALREKLHQYRAHEGADIGKSKYSIRAGKIYDRENNAYFP